MQFTIRSPRPPVAVALALLTAFACGCEQNGASGRWQLDADATVAANRETMLEQAQGFAPDAALEQLRRAFDGATMQYELTSEGTFTATRALPNITTGRTYERDESGVWGHLAAGSDELLFVVQVANGAPVEEERPATLVDDRLEIETPHGAGTFVYVFDRAD